MVKPLSKWLCLKFKEWDIILCLRVAKGEILKISNAGLRPGKHSHIEENVNWNDLLESNLAHIFWPWICYRTLSFKNICTTKQRYTFKDTHFNAV